jgi:hypothetical protein
MDGIYKTSCIRRRLGSDRLGREALCAYLYLSKTNSVRACFFQTLFACMIVIDMQNCWSTTGVGHSIVISSKQYF